ncbi:hypothetical protein GQ457_04G018710 [Hibiscus cannabinus]
MLCFLISRNRGNRFGRSERGIGCFGKVKTDFRSLTLWRQEGKEDQGITFVQVRFCGYGSMYKQWGGYALFWSMLDSFKLMRCCGS